MSMFSIHGDNSRRDEKYKRYTLFFIYKRTNSKKFVSYGDKQDRTRNWALVRGAHAHFLINLFSYQKSVLVEID